MEIKNLFLKGKMNKDADERVIPNGEYIDALNIRVANTAGSDVGAIENELGNTKLTRISESNNPVCIGSVADESNEKIYWCVVDDNQYSYIYEYDNVNEITSIVLEDTRGGSAQVLGFDKNHKITGINVIFNKSNNQSILLFTDNLNPPRMVNVERAKAYGANGFDEDDINLYKKPPRKAPVVSPFNTASEGENAVREKLFSFSYRYRYLDGEYSALSSFTKYQFTPGVFDLDYETMENRGMLNTYNAYNISYNTGDKRVTDIQICFKNPLDGIVYVIDTINKEENDLLNNVERSFVFTNNKVYKALPSDELNRLFDNVPLRALAQEIIENRLVFGNYTSQYDIKENESDERDIKIDYSASLISRSREGEEQSYTISASETEILVDLSGVDFFEGSAFTVNAYLQSTLTGSIPNQYFGGSFGGNNTVILSQNYVDASAFAASPEFSELLSALNANFASSVDTTSPPNTTSVSYGSFTVSASTATSITLLAPTIEHTVDNTPGDPNDNDFTDITETFKWLDISQALYRVTANTLSLKSNRSYDFGICYLDEYGRYSTIIPNSDDSGTNKSSFFVPVENSININRPEITINHKAPYWADRYKIFAKPSKQMYYNIYATTFYDEGLYKWVLLNGNNTQKVEEGMNLIVKSDDNGPLDSEVKVKVLEVTTKSGSDVVENDEGWLIGNRNASDDPIKEIQGTYMKIRPEGFTMDFKENSFLSYINSDKVIGGGFAETVLPKELDKGLFQYNDGTNFVDIDLPQGSRIYMLLESWDSRDRTGDESRFFEQEYIVNDDYVNTTGGQTAFHKWLIAETNWTIPAGQTYYTDPNEQFQLTFEFNSSTNRHTITVKTTEYTQIFTERGTIEAKITIQRTNGVLIFETDTEDVDNDIYYETEEVFDIENGLHLGNKQSQTSTDPAIVELNFGNCYSFGNGVESISVRDERLGSTLSVDYRPNIALIDAYKQITEKNGLIYSGSFNENTGYNSLNEFNASRGNTKYMDLKYGSIQHLHARETDLVVLQEDQVSKVLYGKNVLYGADGTGSLSQVEAVLGQVVPFSGEYGIAKNPESFAEHGGRLYFTDALRGAVLQLGGDGLTAISDFGMESYFRTELSAYTNKFNIGGYDAKYGQYVITMDQSDKPIAPVEYFCSTQYFRDLANAESFSYTLNVGENAGTMTFEHEITGGVDVSVVYNGTTHTFSDVSGTNQFSFPVTSLDLDTTSLAQVTVTANEQSSVAFKHVCPEPGTREIVIVVLNDIDDAGKTIVNRYKVNTGSYYSKTDTFTNDGVSRNETLLGIGKNPYTPLDQDTVTISSFQEIGVNDGMYNSCSRMGYMVSDSVLTPSQVQDQATFLTETVVNIDGVSKEAYASFTFNPATADDKLYLIFDYQDGACTPIEDPEDVIPGDGAEQQTQ
jgi:hypothetical protein